MRQEEKEEEEEEEDTACGPLLGRPSHACPMPPPLIHRSGGSGRRGTSGMAARGPVPPNPSSFSLLFVSCVGARAPAAAPAPAAAAAAAANTLPLVTPLCLSRRRQI